MLSNQRQTILPPGLYVVATPIGNLGDITLRALEVLRDADTLYCEDTRVTAKLLNHYGITTHRVAYHEHNADTMHPQIMAAIASGKAVALVSDAGTPLISDPGYRLVRLLQEAALPVYAIPGASSLTAALSIAGLPTMAVHFVGFLPAKAGERRSLLHGLSSLDATLVCFESPQRIAATLALMQEVWGDREAAVARELTKLHETVRRGTLSELAEYYAAQERVRGEIVLIVAPPGVAEPASEQDLDAALQQALATLSFRDAVAAVSASLQLPRKIVYARALQLR